MRDLIKQFRTSSLLVVVGFLWATYGSCSELESEQQEEIDSIFQSWNEANSPGGVIGVVLKGQHVFARAYGLASLEYGVENSLTTRFNLASVSKQMTAVGIVKLHLANRLSIDDDIRKYLPDLPDFGATITLRHLLHHTSGLRSNHALLRLAGWRHDDARDNDDLYRFMLRQRDLNFNPGDDYLYCNTGYIFLAMIIEKVTGETFADWMKREVFESLHLYNTYVDDNYRSVIKNRATSYFGNRKPGHERAVEYWGYTGAGNVYSTLADLQHWLGNFYQATGTWQEAFHLLETLDPLNNGRTNDYGFGVVVDRNQGQKCVRHSGAIGGFRSVALVYPEAGLSIAILANFATANVGAKADRIAEIVLGSREKSEKDAGIEEHISIELSPEMLASITGSYWAEREAFVRKIILRDNQLVYYRNLSDESVLIPIADTEFLFENSASHRRLHFGTAPNGQRNFTIFDEKGVLLSATLFEPVEPTEKVLKEYVGEFFSPELETTYVVSFRENGLIVRHPRHGEHKASFVKSDVLRSANRVIQYTRDPTGRVIGIRVSNGRVRNLRMRKISDSPGSRREGTGARESQ